MNIKKIYFFTVILLSAQYCNILLSESSSLLFNKISKIFKWKDGDLLFGTNTDRHDFVHRLGLENYFQTGKHRPFSRISSHHYDIHNMPKLLDDYTSILCGFNLNQEIQNTVFLKYKESLTEFHLFLRNNPHYLQPLGTYPLKYNNLTHFETVSNPILGETMANICLGGLDFFTSKNITIHFIINNYLPGFNKATEKEIEWIRARWHLNHINQKIKFYLIRGNTIKIVDPEKYNWFKSKKLS